MWPAQQSLMDFSFKDIGPDFVRVKIFPFVILSFHNIHRIDLSDLVWKALIRDIDRLARIPFCAVKGLVCIYSGFVTIVRYPFPHTRFANLPQVVDTAPTLDEAHTPLATVTPRYLDLPSFSKIGLSIPKLVFSDDWCFLKTYSESGVSTSCRGTVQSGLKLICRRCACSSIETFSQENFRHL